MCNVDNIRFLIGLPLSKSIRARELVLDALAGEKIEIEDDNASSRPNTSRGLPGLSENKLQVLWNG